MAHLVAFAALHIGEVLLFGAISNFVARFAATLASKRIDTGLRAIAGTVANLLTVDALNDRLD